MEENLLIPLSESLGKSFEVSSDIFVDLAESSIDQLIESQVLSEIPIVKSVLAIVKIGSNIRERHLLKNALAFVISFNNSTNDPEIKNRILELLEDSKKREKELGRVMLLLDRQLDIEKSKILASFYTHFLLKRINWDKFCELTDALDRVFINDINSLILAYKTSDKYVADISELRLLAAALMSAPHIFWSGSEDGQQLQISSFGKEFIEYGGLLKAID